MSNEQKIDYKKIIHDKRLEAGKLMTKEQITKCNIAIHAAAATSGVCGAIPIPIADAIPMSAAQVTMVVALGKIFDQEITEVAAKGLIGAAASTFVGRELVKLIPVAGWAISAGVAATVTEAIGWILAVDMANKFRAEWDRKRNAKNAADAYAEAEYYKKANEDSNNYDNEAEDFSE